jgi:hypothetical protein
MKRLMVLVVGLVFMFSTFAIAADKAAPVAPAGTTVSEPAKDEAKVEKKEVKKVVKKKATKKKATKKKAEKADDAAAPATK